MNFYNIELPENKYTWKQYAKEIVKPVAFKTPGTRLDLRKIRDILSLSIRKELGYVAKDEELVRQSKDKKWVIPIMTGRREAKGLINLEKLYEINREKKKEISKLLLNGKDKLSAVVSNSSTKDDTIAIPEHLSGWINLYLLTEDFEDLDPKQNTVKIKGQTRKFSREFQKWLKNECELDDKKVESLSQDLSKVWGTKQKINFVWSVDPTDFMRQSLGSSGWSSCHRVSALRDGKTLLIAGSGPSAHPWVHYSLDEVSTIVYLTSHEEPAIAARIMVYINTDKKTATIGRAYPNATNASGVMDYIKKELKRKGFKINNEDTEGQPGGVLEGFRMSSDGWAYFYRDYENDHSVDMTPKNTVGTPRELLGEVLLPWE